MGKANEDAWKAAESLQSNVEEFKTIEPGNPNPGFVDIRVKGIEIKGVPAEMLSEIDSVDGASSIRFDHLEWVRRHGMQPNANWPEVPPPEKPERRGSREWVPPAKVFDDGDGRAILSVNGCVMVMEGDICREPTLTENYWTRSRLEAIAEHINVKQYAQFKRDASGLTANPDGLYNKYVVLRSDGNAHHPSAEFFVLRIDPNAEPVHGLASCVAAMAYYEAVRVKLLRRGVSQHLLPMAKELAEKVLRACPTVREWETRHRPGIEKNGADGLTRDDARYWHAKAAEIQASRQRCGDCNNLSGDLIRCEGCERILRIYEHLKVLFPEA